MESTTDPNESQQSSVSPSKTTSAMDGVIQMPTTAQLMELVKHVNPFDQKFREANESLKSGDFSQLQILSALSTSSPNGPGASYDATTPDSSVAGRKSSSAQRLSSDLRLQLPDASAITAALSGVCSILNVDDVGGCGLDTPDIANFMTQMKEESSKAAPLTADVLKTVLEMRETLDLQKQRKASDLAAQAQLVEQAAAAAAQERQVDRLAGCGGQRDTSPGITCCTQQEDIGRCDSLLSADSDALQISCSPPALPTHECAATGGIFPDVGPSGQGHSVLQAHSFGPAVVTTAPQTSSQSGNRDDVIIALKIGDQNVQIPLRVNVSAYAPPNYIIPDHGGGCSLASTPNYITTRLNSPMKSDAIATHGSATTSMPRVLPASQAMVFPTVVIDPKYDGKNQDTLTRDLSSTPSAETCDEETRKREILERNKQAAFRYRKRKKEEISTLQEKLKKTETEKLELSTQVQVLRMELERLRNILDLHKDCPVMQEQRKKQQKLALAAFDNHAPLFHTLLTNRVDTAEGSQSGGAAKQDGQPSAAEQNSFSLAETSENSDELTRRVSAATSPSNAPALIASTPRLILSSQPTVFSSPTGSGQFLHYVALPSQSQTASSKEDGGTAAGQQSYILQPFIVPSAQAAMVLPAVSSPLILPTIVRVNAPATSQGSGSSSTNPSNI